MKPEKFFFPLMVFAAVATVWLLLRKNPDQTTQTQPSTSASGIPNYATESPTSYNVQTPQLGNAPALVYLNDPMSNDPAGTASKKPPTYLSFNFGPSHDLTKVPLPDLHSEQKKAQGNGDCGCGGCSDSRGCSLNNSAFPDGAGVTIMASSPRAQEDNAPKSFLRIATDNLGLQPDDFLAPSPSIPQRASLGAQYIPGGFHGGSATLDPDRAYHL